MKANNCDLGVANEGSFGPHPFMPFVSADDEFVILIDTLNSIEITAREISVSTNLGGREIQALEELLEFAASAHFPSHALILRKSPKESKDIYK